MIQYASRSDKFAIVKDYKHIGIRAIKPLEIKPGSNSFSTDLYLWTPTDVLLLLEWKLAETNTYLSNTIFSGKEELILDVYSANDKTYTVEAGTFILLAYPIMSAYINKVETEEIGAIWFI